MRLQTSLATVLLAAAPMAVFASAPNIGVDRDPPGATPVTSPNFAFGADNSGGGDFSFLNESGQAWKELSVFTLLTAQTPAPVCFAGPFKTCAVAGSVDQSGNIAYTISFGTGQFVAIPNGEGFTLNLNDQGTDPNGTGSWPAGQDFTAKANDVTPEPSAGMLFLAGGVFGAFCRAYRRRSRVG